MGLQAKLLPVDVAPDTQNIADGPSAADGTALAAAVRPNMVANFLFKRMSLLNNPRSNVAVTLSATGPGGTSAMDGVKLGDPITFSVTIDKPAFVTLLGVGSGGSLNVLLPNDLFKGDQRAQPGTPYMVPPPNGGFVLSATAPTGPTMVIAIVTSKPFDISSLNVQTIPSLRGIGRVPSPEIRGRNIRDIVATQAGGESEADEWGSAFIVVPINP